MSSLRRHAYDRFLKGLHRRELELGASYTQAELCRLLEVSVSPLQSALKRLEAEDFVTIRSRAGIVVNKPDLADFRETQQLRQILEMASIGQYAATAAPDELAALADDVRELRARAQAREPSARLAEAHDGIEERLHGGIVAALGNRKTVRIHATNMDRYRLMRPESGTLTHRHFIDAADEHLAILDAAVARDAPAASERLRLHLAASLQRAIMTNLFTGRDA